MNEVLPGDTESTTSSNTDLVLIDEIIDLATTKHIEEDTENVVYDTDADFKEIIDGPGVTRIEKDHGNGSYDISGWGPSFACIKHGDYWYGVRGQFEYIKDTFQIVDSYKSDWLSDPIQGIGEICRMLAPSSPATEIESLSSSNKSETLTVNSSWADAESAAEFLEDWHGRAAEAFRGIYINRIGWILCGHTLIAQCLSQSLLAVNSSYGAVKSESMKAANVIYDMLEAYSPTSGLTEEDKKHASTTLAVIAGIGTIVAAAAAVPTGGASIAAAAGIISGMASIASAAANNIEVKDLESKLNLGGDTVVDIMDSLETYVRTVIDISMQAEKELAKSLQDCNEYSRGESSEDGISVSMTIGEDIKLKHIEAYFCPREPLLSGVSPDSTHADVQSNDLMGQHENEGYDLAMELSQLLKVGHEYVPSLASNFSDLAGKNVGGNIAPGLTHLDGDGQSVAPLLESWNALYERLNYLMSKTAENLNIAADGLILAAESFAAQDEVAAAELREASKYFE